MILKMKFRKCLKVFNFKLLFIFILFITGCSGPEDSFLPIKAKLINGFLEDVDPKLKLLEKMI